MTSKKARQKPNFSYHISRFFVYECSPKEFLIWKSDVWIFFGKFGIWWILLHNSPKLGVNFATSSFWKTYRRVICLEFQSHFLPKFVHKIDWDIRIMDPYFQQQKTPEECRTILISWEAKFIDRFLSLEALENFQQEKNSTRQILARSLSEPKFDVYHDSLIKRIAWGEIPTWSKMPELLFICIKNSWHF